MKITKFCSSLLFFFLIGSVALVEAQSILPIPLTMQQKEGAFSLSNKTAVYTNLKKKERTLLLDYLTSFPVQLQKGDKKQTANIITLLLAPKDAQYPSNESYTLSVTPRKIEIKATASVGLFYGLQSLLQLAQPIGMHRFSVQSVAITDTPRFEYRGFMLDVSRHFSSVAFVKKQLDAMAYYKLNRLHLHLTDGAGWRIEIKKYPLLTTFAAWRPEPICMKWWQQEGGRKYCRFDAPGASGGFYTQEDIRELVAYAERLHITIIPEIEMPGHSEEVLAAYPALSCAGEPYKSSDFCVGNEQTFTFLEDVLTEVMALFPSKYIHIGGDEAGKGAWKSCPKCQKRMQTEKLANVDELQSYMIHRMETFLNAHGRQLLGWDEILQGGLAPNATVMSWRGEKGGIAAVKAGHPAIMTPGAFCYLDGYQDAPSTQPEAIGGYLPLQKVYSYDPVPSTLTAAQQKLIKGVQANLWMEYISTPEHREYMIYPRLLALAEVAWSAPARKSWPNFYQRALQATDFLQSKGYHTFNLRKEVGNRPEAATPVQHLARGKSVVYKEPISPSYPAQGTTTLTDGIRGGWSYNDGVWQGFIDKNRLDVVIDMDEVTDLHSISADFMQVVGPQVFLPSEVIISISTDGKTFTELSRQKNKIVKSSVVLFTNFGWKGAAKGRYIRYQALAGKAFGGWIFTDEIVVK